jgi:hypothetical protein
MFCTRPNWGGEAYLCRFLVTIERIGKGKTYHDEPEQDWTNLTEKFEYFDEEDYNRSIEAHKDNTSKVVNKDFLRRWSTKRGSRLKPEVIKWLNENIKDRDDKEHPKGWCCGDEAYLATNSLSISLFFERRSDAMAFIKRWSVYDKPTTYFDYFREIRKELNPETNTLQTVKELSR